MNYELPAAADWQGRGLPARWGFMLCRKTSFTPHFLNKTTAVAAWKPPKKPHYLIVWYWVMGSEYWVDAICQKGVIFITAGERSVACGLHSLVSTRGQSIRSTSS
jgi:hypothetical protein